MPLPRRAALFACAALALVASAAAWGRPKPQPGGVSALGGYALPSEIVAASIGWGHLATAKGWWNAVRAFSTPDAQIVIGNGTQRAQLYAKGRAEPATLPHRRTHHVWMSCDGSIGAEEGLFDDGAAHGWYLTIWQHDAKKGEFKWLLDQTGTQGGGDDFDFIEGKVGDCVPRPRGAPAPVALADGTGPIEIKPVSPGNAPSIVVKGETNAMADHLIGIARDHTLSWATRFGDDGVRRTVVSLLMDGKKVEVLKREER